MLVPKTFQGLTPGQARFLDRAAALHSESVHDREALGFVARVLVQATFPHSDPKTNEWSRTNGNLTVSMLSPSAVGLPYGSYPRLLMSWVTTEALRNKARIPGAAARRLDLGNSLSAFMAQLGLLPTGGRWGTIPRLRDQMERLFSTTIIARMEDHDAETGLSNTMIQPRVVANRAVLWWNPATPGDGVLWGSYVELSEPFYTMITERPVPVDMDVLRLLKRSPMAIDAYCWATYRVSYLKRPAMIPWRALMMQMGAGYPDTVRGQQDFKRNFRGAMRKVLAAWPALRVDDDAKGVTLRPCRSHVRQKLK